MDVTGQRLPLEVVLQSTTPAQVRFNTLTYELRDVQIMGDKATVRAWQRSRWA